MENPQGDHDKLECVGSLIVHSQDVRELSGMPTTYTTSSEPNVCVGSVLLPSHDVQELDSVHMPTTMAAAVSPDVTKDLKKRPTAGTILLPPPLLHPEHVSNKTSRDDSGIDQEKSSSPSLMRRITKKLMEPASPDADEDYQFWTD